MAPNLSEDEIDDMIYFARAGEASDLNDALTTLSAREGVTPAQILQAAKDEGKSTCLHMATGNGNLEIVTILVQAFSDQPKEEKQTFLDAPNEFGNTGLHWAALGGHLDVVKFLVAEGASPALANDKNYIPLDLASFSEKMNVVDFFLSQMDNLENQNQDDGLGSAAAAVDLDGDEKDQIADQKTKTEEAEESKPSNSS
ncbi:ankyrin [Cryphonectria parasitica EP155]|uniref:Ankyrin n=1 Tax=Cryphonectria parasitica (strain ATCC 38755 / EP155) TaxID=660469 RepID=A0A9P5CX32_CRYP1|nr:ankyrin [Cryphonectria parasitica EP155]KAF3771395.1 ankyrin [Cryphonectria parasitica EP155]